MSKLITKHQKGKWMLELPEVLLTPEFELRLAEFILKSKAEMTYVLDVKKYQKDAESILKAPK